MVTREGFNALLKIVEEPPEHIKFIFVTTELSKMLLIMLDAEGNGVNFPRFEDDPRRAVQQATGTGWDVPPPATVALAQTG